MAKARRVRGVRPKASLRDNARKIISTRIAELLSWREALGDAQSVRELHDLRIAAKRLRYALEIFDTCFPDAKELLADLTQLQDMVGDIHDLDVLIDIVRARLRSLDQTAEDAAVAVMASHGSAAERNTRLRQVLYAQARDRRRLGLFGLLAGYIAQRHDDFEKLQIRWGGDTFDRFAARVHSCVADTGSPPPEPASKETGAGVALAEVIPAPANGSMPEESPTEPWWSTAQR